MCGSNAPDYLSCQSKTSVVSDATTCALNCANTCALNCATNCATNESTWGAGGRLLGSAVVVGSYFGTTAVATAGVAAGATAGVPISSIDFVVTATTVGGASTIGWRS